MSAANEYADLLARRLAPPSRPLDEDVWNAWIERGQARERRDAAARLNIVKWVSIGALSVLVALWSLVATYDSIFRFVVAGGALALMFHEYHVRRLGFAAVFAALVVLYNPVAPVFAFSGDWQRAVVFATFAPFVASFAREARVRRHA